MTPFPEKLRTSRLVLQRLSTGMEAPLQAVFEAAGDHFTTVTGRPVPEPDAAERELRSAEAVEGREVLLIRLSESDEPIGAVGFWERHPAPEIALLGMLLIDRRHRGQGYAREALASLEETLRNRGVQELRTGVGAGDVRRHEVLRALGFSAADERRHVSLDRGRVMIAIFQKEIPPAE